jgi:hypothetical protein
MTAAGLAPDRSMADLLAATVAAHDTMSEVAQRVVSELRAEDAARHASQQWLTTIGPTIFATVPQVVVEHSNHLEAVAARLARGVDATQLAVVFEALEHSTAEQVRAVYVLDQDLESFRAAVAKAASGSAPGSPVKRFHAAAERLRQLHALLLAAWKRVLATTLIVDRGALTSQAAEVQRAVEAWRQLAALAGRLQLSDLSLSVPPARSV